MTRFSAILPFLLLLFCLKMAGQKKSLQAVSVTENITINGKLDETVWNSAPIATDFVMFEPDNGKPLDHSKRTEVRILYDNKAIYVAAVMYDDEPQKMLREITERDDFGTSEHFGIFINGFNDGQQDYRFFVSAAGVQMDALATEATEDFSWNAIWESSVKVTDFGWVVEMRIPYAALRFSPEAKQTWGLNFFRELRRYRQKYTWNRVNTQIGAFIPQAGILEGIENIKPPTRLFLIPYASYYYDYTDHEAGNTFKAGLDIKYGINDSFTLDAILVPDFGQTKFDNVVLNLTPFEQQFNENRPFFTEGTDIFNKGSLLYSRRIGGPPVADVVLSPDEEIIESPNSVDLLNALKLSGRTKGGLGIGVLNAVTERTFAKIRNTVTQETREALVSPLVNYNLLVLDQRFGGNSSVSLVNANTFREGNFRDANVSALVWDLNTKANTYKLAGDFKYSTINETVGFENGYDGFKTAVNFIKTHGNHRYDLLAKYISKDYDINDMGIAFINNYYNFYANYNYRILNPTKTFNSFRFDLSSSIEFQNQTGKVQDYYWIASTNFNSKKNDYWNASINVHPITSYDFYQPRVDGRYSYNPRTASFSTLFSSNYNRKFAIDVNPYVSFADEQDRNVFEFYVSPRYRINDRVLLVLSGDYIFHTNDRGFVDFDGTDILFGERDRKTVTAELSGRYSINNRMTFNLTARYYWSYAEYDELFTLRNDGFLNYLTNNPATVSPYDENLNLWNFDLTYSWWFAPASQISVLYRNNALDYRTAIENNLGRNVDNLFSNNLNSVFSISVRYFIDYNSLRRKS
ncbi:MAG: hydrolase [Flavobacterium sp.]|nr:MAG: hydrolase [Flavobacterium sp.]